MSIKVRRQNSYNPEPTVKEKGAGIVCAWHILHEYFLKVKKFTPKKCDSQN